jgi:AraC family transcriptional regulator
MKAAILGKIAHREWRSAAVVARALAQRQIEGRPGAATSHMLARGNGWSAKDVICTHSRNDRPFEERHGAVSVALVLAGTFQYRCGDADELLAPGALLLGNYGECFECRHEHAAGDRCVAFHFTPEYFERIAADAGHKSVVLPARIPAIRELARLSAIVSADLSRENHGAWEETAINVADAALSLSHHHHRTRRHTASRQTLARITDSIRSIEEKPDAQHTLERLANDAGVSSYYYLRIFERVTGVTPHQFILRMRLRAAADRIAREDTQIAQIAFQSGFGDLSNFNHTFKAEFGVSPRAWRGALIAPRPV